MKKIIPLLIFVFMSNLIFGHDETERGIFLQYEIKKRSVDKTLPEGEGRLKISFYENKKEMKSHEFAIGLNDKTFNLKTNDKGVIETNADKGKHKIYFYADGYFEIITDSISISSQEVIELNVYMQKADVMIIVDKPVIYIYSEKKMEVEVKLNVKGELKFTYPVYNDGWKFIASPDGNLSFNEKNYNYLFWDSKMNLSQFSIDNSGFIVASDTLLSFLENSLNQMGFNSKESADFITYWYPRMAANPLNFVHFLFNDDCKIYADLNISPQPDQVFRVGMLWSKTESTILPVPQKIEKIQRKGFTLLEWGGVEISNEL